MCTEDNNWHYDYVRLAWDTGFSFEKFKSSNLDKNKICLVDIERILKERDVGAVDRFIPTIVQYILEEEQAKVLDTNFVKMFRISQLAVEFLLFCKKYLDNTVVLLKKELNKYKEENKELVTFNEELRMQLTKLISQQSVATFKCNICSKVFSSEDFLNSHIKRRHNSSNSENDNPQNDKLNLEIKELKERLNNTEKLLKEKDERNKENVVSVDRNYEIWQIVKSFEEFKTNVDVELNQLKKQNNFYEENYSKLFDKIEQSYEPKQVVKSDNTTQTDEISLQTYQGNTSQIETKEHKDSTDELGEKPLENILETKISATLANIEGQMEAFWTKMNDIKDIQIIQSPVKVQTIDEVDTLPPVSRVHPVTILTTESKPKAKPRSKLTPVVSNQTDEVEKLQREIDKLEAELRAEQNSRKKNCDLKELNEIVLAPKLVSVNAKRTLSAPKLSKNVPINENETDTESELESSTEPDTENLEISPVERIRKYQDNEFESRQTVKGDFKEEVYTLLAEKLQDIGVSDQWTGIPQNTFDKSIQIVKHHGDLIKKVYPNFNMLKKNIEKRISEQCSKASFNNENKKHVEKISKQQNIIKLSYRTKSKTKSGNTSSPLQINNRALYETDSESDNSYNSPMKAVHTNPEQRFADVISELKANQRIYQDEQFMNPDVSNKKDELQKGVLKSFPSVGSLSKKKVIFDLDSETSKTDDIPVIPKIGGSTTSIASSILEDDVQEDVSSVSKKRDNQHDTHKDFKYETDLELSDV